MVYYKQYKLVSGIKLFQVTIQIQCIGYEAISVHLVHL